MRRLPIRVRLTLAFAGVMAIVLTLLGTYLYVRFARDLDASLNQGLRSRAGDVTALVRQADSGLSDRGGSPASGLGEGFAQIIDERGRVIDVTPGLPRRSLLDRATLATARRRSLIVDRDAALPTGERVRLLATPVTAQDRREVVVVGASLGDRNDALTKLLALLLVGGPIALLLASGAGYGVASAALRPVEAMRRRAAEIGGAGVDQRLPRVAGDDELARLASTLNAMLDRLGEALERERTFVADASHELRTPLTVLKAELELASRAGRSAEELRAAVRSAADETDRLVRLAEDLLVIARSDRGALPVRATPIAASELLERTRERFARRIEDRGRDMGLESDQGLVVYGDPLRLDQALGNLIDNALTHGAGRVLVSAHELPHGVELKVRDEGDGFPPGFADRAFERFARADGARGRGGAGLGLAIVAAIARAHGGSVHAGAGGSGGAEVTIRLPRR